MNNLRFSVQTLESKQNIDNLNGTDCKLRSLATKIYVSMSTLQREIFFMEHSNGIEIKWEIIQSRKA